MFGNTRYAITGKYLVVLLHYAQATCDAILYNSNSLDSYHEKVVLPRGVSLSLYLWLVVSASEGLGSLV